MKKSLQVLYKNKIATGQYMKERQKDKKKKMLLEELKQEIDLSSISN